MPRATPLPSYATYKSPYGPNYKIQPNIHGIGPKNIRRYGITAASFGLAAGVFALFFFSDVPKVRNDIMLNIPYVGEHFRKEVPASDNPF